MRAQSRLAELGIRVPLAPGERSGDDGNGFEWRIRISSPTLAHIDAQAQPLGLYGVEVRIGWHENRIYRQVLLQTQRLGPGGAGR